MAERESLSQAADDFFEFFNGELDDFKSMAQNMLMNAVSRMRSNGMAVDGLRIAFHIANKYGRELDKPGLTKMFKSHVVVYNMSKTLKSSLKIEIGPETDLQKVILDHSPGYATSDTLADAIMGVWFDDIDVYLALAALRARDVKIAYTIRDALASD